MFVTDIKNSVKDAAKSSLKKMKGELSMVFNSKTVAGLRAAIEGGSVGYKAATLVMGLGLLATPSLPLTAAVAVGIAALTAFVTINDYQKFRNGQQAMLGSHVGSMEGGLMSALKLARRFPSVAGRLPLPALG